MAHYKGSSQNSSLIKQDGQKVIIPPKALDIIWGGDSRYWRLPDTEGGPVELLQVCWLEVTGSVALKNLNSNGKKYKVTFEVSTKPDAFGWSESPVYLMAKVGSEYTWKKADLSSMKPNERKTIPDSSVLTFSFNADQAKDEKVSFGLYEIWRGRWKGGLLIHQVIIEPTQ